MAPSSAFHTFNKAQLQLVPCRSLDKATKYNKINNPGNTFVLAKFVTTLT